MLTNSIYKVLKPFYLILIFLSLFKGVFAVAFKTHVFEYLDEILFLFSILILLPIILFSKKIKLIHFIVVTFIAYSILISILFGVSGNFLTIALQSLITIKFFIILLAFIELLDRKSTRLNSSHVKISYAVFCLNKKMVRTPG